MIHPDDQIFLLLMGFALYKIPDICCQLREGRVVCVALELFNIDNFLSQS